MRAATYALLVFTFSACSDATGSLQGGGALPLPTVSTSGTGVTSGAASGASGSASAGSGGAGSSAGGAASSGSAAPTPTWGYIYATYMAPTNTGACGSLMLICHQLATDTGPKQNPPVSGFVCGTTAQECYQGMLNATPPLIGPSFTANPTMAPLYLALWNGAKPGATSNNMPQTLGYQFGPSDFALVAQWIQNGAKESP